MERDYILPIAIVIGIGAFSYLLLHFDMGRLFSILFSSDIEFFIAFVLTAIAMFIGFAFTWNVLLSPYNIYISPMRLFNLRMVGMALSYVTPGPRIGGEIVRSKLAEKSTHKILVSSVIEKICFFFASTAVIVAGILAAPLLFTVETYLLPTVLLIVIVVFYVLYHSARHANRVVAWLQWAGVVPERYYEQFDTFGEDITLYFTEHKQIMYAGVGLIIGCKVLLVLQLYFILAMLGLHATLFQSLYLVVGIEIAYAIPGYMGIGVLELSQVTILSLLKLDGELGVLVALLTRARDLTASAYGLAVLSYLSHNGSDVSLFSFN